MAVAVLAAAGVVPAAAAGDTVLIGELGLDGQVRPVRGVLPALLAARAVGRERAIVPAGESGRGGVGDRDDGVGGGEPGRPDRESQGGGAGADPGCGGPAGAAIGRARIWRMCWVSRRRGWRWSSPPPVGITWR